MWEMFQYEFMQRAFLAGLIVAIICPTIGMFLVLRRLSMIGDTLSHVSLAGIAAGLLAGFGPVQTMYMGIGFSVAAALAIERLRKKYEQYAELSIAILLSVGIGLATILISMGKSNAGIFGYLFGSIGLVSVEDLQTIWIMGVFIIISVVYYYRHLFYITFDEESARLIGIPVRWLSIFFTVLVALTIALAMRIVGILLVSSLMTIPAATSLQIARSFKQAVWYAVGFGIFAVFAGLILAFWWNLAPGGTIVMTAVGMLMVVLGVKSGVAWMGKRRYT